MMTIIRKELFVVALLLRWSSAAVIATYSTETTSVASYVSSSTTLASSLASSTSFSSSSSSYSASASTGSSKIPAKSPTGFIPAKHSSGSTSLSGSITPTQTLKATGTALPTCDGCKYSSHGELIDWSGYLGTIYANATEHLSSSLSASITGFLTEWVISYATVPLPTTVITLGPSSTTVLTCCETYTFVSLGIDYMIRGAFRDSEPCTPTSTYNFPTYATVEHITAPGQLRNGGDLPHLTFPPNTCRSSGQGLKPEPTTKTFIVQIVTPSVPVLVPANGQAKPTTTAMPAPNPVPMQIPPPASQVHNDPNPAPNQQPNVPVPQPVNQSPNTGGGGGGGGSGNNNGGGGAPGGGNTVVPPQGVPPQGGQAPAQAGQQTVGGGGTNQQSPGNNGGSAPSQGNPGNNGGSGQNQGNPGNNGGSEQNQGSPGGNFNDSPIPAPQSPGSDGGSSNPNQPGQGGQSQPTGSSQAPGGSGEPGGTGVYVGGVGISGSGVENQPQPSSATVAHPDPGPEIAFDPYDPNANMSNYIMIPFRSMASRPNVGIYSGFSLLLTIFIAIAMVA